MKKLLPLILGLFLCASAGAEQIFLLFDGSCGERIRYEQAVAQQPRSDYYAYNFNLPGGNKLFLETGQEGNVTQGYLPDGYIYCNDPRLNAELVDRVNGQADRVFILLPLDGGQFLVQPVVMAGLMTRQGDVLTYQSPLSSYQFDNQNAIIGVNLAYNRPGAKVYFEGRDDNACNGVYLFRQLAPASAYPVIDYKVVPEIGITERRLGSDGRTTSGGVIVARDVNGQPIDQYLASVCARASSAFANTNSAPIAAPQQYSTQPSMPPPTVGSDYNDYVQPESNAYVTPTTTTSEVSHQVSKGETLYAISQRYGTTVDALKVSNGLSGNTVYPGQTLVVTTTTVNNTTAPGDRAQTQNQAPVYQQQQQQQQQAPPRYQPQNNSVAGNATNVPRLPYNPGSIAQSNPGAPAPTPYGNAPTAAATTRGPEPVYGEDVHIVQPGETVASVALKYGYTTARLREMNDLGPAQVIKVGQRLATSDCNCPDPAPVPSRSTAGPQTQPASTVPQPAAYGNTPTYDPRRPDPAPAYRPQSATTVPPAPNSYGGTPTYRPQPAPVPASNDPLPPSERLPSINNNPSFDPVNPSTGSRGVEAEYNSYPIPRPRPAIGASPAAPQPNQYGGTPVGVDVDYSAPAQQPGQQRSFHTVQQGESLFGIGQRYGLTVEQLRTLNQMGPYDLIVPFQKLYLN